MGNGIDCSPLMGERSTGQKSPGHTEMEAEVTKEC